jgi:hypothetical protein
MQRQALPGRGLRASAIRGVERLVRAPGQELDPPLRRFMESRFAQDFGGVRIHCGAEAEASAADLHAIAYTTGSHIVFRPGAYQPQTPHGRRLLAHELSHVVQQRHGQVTGEPVGGLRVSRSDDRFERAADADAAAVVSAPRPESGPVPSASPPAGTMAPAPPYVQRQDDLAPPEQDAAGSAGNGGPECSCSDDDVLAYQSESGTDMIEASSSVQRQPDPSAGPQASDAPVPASDAGSAPQSLPEPCSPDAKACFSISKKTAWLKLPSGVIAVPALGGRKGHPTPQGKSFKVIRKDEHHSSSKYKIKGKGAPMPFYVNFAPAVGFHTGSLTTLSHGCVHLSASAAETFFRNLEVGDRVDVVE